MKHFRYTFLTIILLLGFAGKSIGENTISTTASNIEPADSTIRVSLLTCQPGNEVYSFYGHSAIRFEDKQNGIDVAVNYGMFSFSKPFFVLRFIFGLTDYEMGIIPFDIFLRSYEYDKRGIYEQELNLTNEEKIKLRDAIETNYLPENRVYRYNYIYDNCTTRARDILLSQISSDKTIKCTIEENTYKLLDINKLPRRNISYRDMIHHYTMNHPWSRFGNDLLLGFKADFTTNKKEQQFLPEYLMEDFQTTQIIANNGDSIPLVKDSRWILPKFHTTTESAFPLCPSECFWILFIITIAITAIEFFTRKSLWGYDTLLMSLCGLSGIVLLAMFCSQHPTTSTNLQILILNPLALLFIYRTTKNSIKHRPDSFWLYSIIAIILFLLGGLIQHYAEGMYILALSLLIRCIWNILRYRQHEQ